MSARLSATDLACRRGERVLFTGLSFNLEPGAVLQVAGPNGIGKSSLLRILAGLLRPMTGAIEQVGSLGLVDERPALDEHLPLGQALGFWRALDGTPETLQPWSLEPLFEVPVRYLSTGQRKRAAFARLAAQGADIWLLDEPLNGLDPDGIAAVSSAVESLRRAHGICVLASHQPFPLDAVERLELRDYAA